VRSRTSVEQYRNTQKDLRQIAGELKVTYVVEGSIQKVGDNIKIIAQLIEAKNDGHLWANTYVGKYTDEIFNFQSEVALKIASSLNAVITPKEEESIEKTPTKNIAAYDFYMKGMEMLNKYWELHYDMHLNLAHDLFDRALEIDPDFQYAISAKSGVYLAEGKYDSALIFVERAITIEPENPQGYSVKGDCYMNLGKNDQAKENYLKAISLSTGDEWIWPHYALVRTYLWGMKDPVKGLEFAKKSLEKFDRDPRAYWTIAECYIYVGDYENAEKSYRKRLLLIPGCKGISEVSWVLNVQSKYEEAFDFLDSVCGTRACLEDCNINKFRISMAQKEFEQAQEYYKRFIEIGGVPEITDRIWLAYMYKNLNQEQEALTTLINARMILQNQADKWPVSPPTIIDLASVHALLDEKDKALKYLSDAADLGFIAGWHDYLPECPLFESLWDDPKFKTIVKRAREEKAAFRARIEEEVNLGKLEL
jgi:tetratricopeptide (TPR) repeat protein